MRAGGSQLEAVAEAEEEATERLAQASAAVLGQLPSDAKPSLAEALKEEVGGAPSDVNAGLSSFLSLEILMFFGGHLLDAYCAFLLVLMPLKGFWFGYPNGWHLAEGFLLAICFCLQRIQHFFGAYGNRAQSSPNMSAFVTLTTPVLLLSGYFTGLQCYVLHLEFVLGLLVIALLTLQFLIGVGVSTLWSKTGRETGVAIFAAFLGLGALVMVLVMVFKTNTSQDGIFIAFIVGLFLMSVSLILSIVACALSLDL